MAQCIKDSGWMTINMEKAKNNGLIIVVMKACSNMDRRVDKAFTFGLTKANMKGNGTTIESMVMGSIHGLVERHMKVNGRIV